MVKTVLQYSRLVILQKNPLYGGSVIQLSQKRPSQSDLRPDSSPKGGAKERHMPLILSLWERRHGEAVAERTFHKAYLNDIVYEGTEF